MSSARSDRHRRSATSKACRRTNRDNECGSSSAPGISAPCTRTGTIFLSRASANSSSRRTRSSGLSRRRRPCLSVAVTHERPTIAMTTSHLLIASWTTSVKSVPTRIVSTSMNTRSSPNRAARASYSRPACAALSSQIGRASCRERVSDIV
jgi:hypothetical protein